MLDSIYVGMTGLLGYSRGLRVIANNTANMNTPGFKSSNLQFADMFYSGQSGLGEQGYGHLGHGLNTTDTALSFKSGELRQTSNTLDLAVDGDGLFVLKKESGEITYTRAGQFEFNTDGVLVTRGGGAKVMGQSADKSLVEISIAGFRTGAGKASSTISFAGNLSSTATEQTVNGVKVVDAAGGEHTLSAKFTNTGATSAGSWQVELFDGTTSVGTGQIVFIDGRPQVGSSTVSINYSPAGASPVPLTLDFSKDVTSYASGSLSTLAVGSQDGYGPGALTGVAFDNAGILILTYANGQTVKGSQLALGRFDSPDAVEAVGDNEFKAVDGRAWHQGSAATGSFGKIQSGMIELSNVDLSREFGDLVIMQRGYQASSQIISTANDMLQELFAMKSK